MTEEVKIELILRNELTGMVLKDTLADSMQNEKRTLNTIFEIGLSVVASHVSPRCPRLRLNLSRWLCEKEDKGI